MAPGGYLFAGKAIYLLVIWDHGSFRELEFLVSGPVEDINRAALINKDFLDEGLTPTKDGGTCLRRLSMFRKEVH